MLVGEAGNFLAYAFATAAVVSPLGAVSVISNAFISSLWLGEPFRLRDILGLLFAITGSISVLLNAPQPPENQFTTIPELYTEITRPFVVTFVFLDLLVVLFLIYVVPRHVAERNVIIYVLVCSLLGSITVMCTKAISTALRITVEQHDNQFKHGFLYVLIAIAVASAVTQVKYLNEAMINFGTSEVVPIYYVFFTLSAVGGGLVLYQEWATSSFTQGLYFTIGAFSTFIGVYIISEKKNSGSNMNMINSNNSAGIDPHLMEKFSSNIERGGGNDDDDDDDDDDGRLGGRMKDLEMKSLLSHTSKI
jgi:magnesium transporter